MSVQRFSFNVHGVVQGVFFRKYAQQSADSLSLSGFVRNTNSGSVAGEAEGSAENLEKFKQMLQEGSPQSTVEKVEWQEIEKRKEGEGQGYGGAKSAEAFSITRGRH
ncbi:Acylphosphatase [Drechslerella dactyloides]|uniref:Acylphosphatase n=1 Tax=Drechslerella dactyloides TaxID=74499 RepID=A0AAD6NKB4_DREDA|nr:Acylphosphatase [Drechslerella dactyloides]